jgi:hypothetical protein
LKRREEKEENNQKERSINKRKKKKKEKKLGRMVVGAGELIFHSLCSECGPVERKKF